MKVLLTMKSNFERKKHLHVQCVGILYNIPEK